MRVSVTGIVEVEPSAKIIVINAIIDILSLGNVTEFTTGGAYGVDSIAAYQAFKYDSEHNNSIFLRVCIPDGKWYNNDTINYADDVEEVDGGYMIRNDRLVYHADILLAFPATSEEEKRSGTWATVRRARKKGIPIYFYPLDGSDPWKENDQIL